MSVRQVTPRWNDGTRLAVRNVLQQFLDAEEQKVGFLRSLLEVEAGVADAAAAALRGVHQDAEQVPLILYPLDTVCLPLSYGGNPGVNGVSCWGVPHHAAVVRIAGVKAQPAAPRGAQKLHLLSPTNHRHWPIVIVGQMPVLSSTLLRAGLAIIGPS